MQPVLDADPDLAAVGRGLQEVLRRPASTLTASAPADLPADGEEAAGRVAPRREAAARSSAAAPSRLRTSRRRRARRAPRSSAPMSPVRHGAALDAVVDERRQVAGVPADDGEAGGHRLAVDDAVGLLGARQHEHVGARRRGPPCARWARCRGARRDPRRSGRAEPVEHRRRYVGSDVLVADEVQGDGVGRQAGDGVEQGEDALARQPVGDAQDGGLRPGPQVVDRRRPAGAGRGRGRAARPGTPGASRRPPRSSVARRSLGTTSARHARHASRSDRAVSRRRMRPCIAAARGAGGCSRRSAAGRRCAGGQERPERVRRQAVDDDDVGIAARRSQHAPAVDDGERERGGSGRTRSAPSRARGRGQLDEAAVVERAARRPARGRPR